MPSKPRISVAIPHSRTRIVLVLLLTSVGKRWRNSVRCPVSLFLFNPSVKLESLKEAERRNETQQQLHHQRISCDTQLKHVVVCELIHYPLQSQDLQY